MTRLWLKHFNNLGRQAFLFVFSLLPSPPQSPCSALKSDGLKRKRLFWQSPIWIGYTLPGAPIQCQPHTSSGRHRLKPNVSVHRPLTPRCSFSLTFCRAFLGLLSESGTGGGLGNPWKGAGSPEPRWQFAPLHFHICPPFVGKGSSTLWCGWLSGIRHS